MNSVTEALKTKAYVAPFAVFMGFTLVWQFGSLVEKGAGTMAVSCSGNRLLCPGFPVEKGH